MASSFITKDNKVGFWVQDNIFQITCTYISKTINAFDQLQYGWLEDFNLILKDNAGGLFLGFMHLNLNDFITSKERIDLISEILTTTKNNLLSKNQEYLSIDELNSLIINKDLQGEWTCPLLISRIIQIINLLEGLLNDEIFSTSADINYLD